MTHLSPHTIDLLAGRQLAPPDLLQASRHLADCAECRLRASEASEVTGRSLRIGADLQVAAIETVHLNYEQLEAYVDDALPVKEREIIKRHFVSCVACLEQARELELLRDNISTYPAVVGVEVDSRKQGENPWDRLVGLFRIKPRKLAFVAAALAVIAVIATLVIWRPAPQEFANTNSGPANDVAENEKASSVNTTPSPRNVLAPGTGAEVAVASPYDGIIKQTIETQRLSTPTSIRDLTGKESQLMGSDANQDRFALISPVGTVIRRSRPTFLWRALPGATSYSVAIFDLNLNLIEKSRPAARPGWTPRQLLKRNVIYIWQVTALKDGREIAAPASPAREARFKILSSDRAAALSRVSSQFADSHLKLGIVYAHDGLLDDAEREFRAAIAANQDAAIARKLLQGARQMRR